MNLRSPRAHRQLSRLAAAPTTQSPALGSALSKAVNDWSSATRDEGIMVHYFLFSIFKLSESAWYQREASVLDGAQWYGWDKAARKYYHSQGVRQAWWPNRRNAYSREFQEYLGGTTAPVDIGSLNDIFDCETRSV